MFVYIMNGILTDVMKRERSGICRCGVPHVQSTSISIAGIIMKRCITMRYEVSRLDCHKTLLNRNGMNYLVCINIGIIVR